MGSPAELPAAGWHADPTAPGVLRWWDGTAWTGHTAPAVAAGLAVSRQTRATRDAVWDLLWNARIWPSWVPFVGSAVRSGDDGRHWRITGQLGAHAFMADVQMEVTLRREVRLAVSALTVDGRIRPAGFDVTVTLDDADGGTAVSLSAGASSPELDGAGDEVLVALCTAAERRKRFMSAVLQRPKIHRVARRDAEGNPAEGPTTLAFKAGWGRRS